MIDDTFKINYKSLPFAVSLETPEYTDVHNHREFEILFFEKGGGKIVIGADEYTADDGDMFFINPFEIHSGEFADSSRICVCFDASIIIDKSISDGINGESLKFVHCIKAENEFSCFLRSEFVKVIESYFEDTRWSANEITAHLSLMMSHLVKNKLVCGYDGESKNKEFCSCVLEYIEKNYMIDITSQAAANALSYNQSYFCRMFKKNFKKTFSEYLNMYRIAISRTIMEDKNLSVAEAAHLSGFNSYSYFSQCFKNHLGMRPSEYIKSEKRRML